MKKIACVAAVAASSLGTAYAQSSVTLFGVVDSGVEIVNVGAGSITRVESGLIAGSRWGLRGVEDLGSGNRIIYTLESGINVDTGVAAQGGLLFGRQAFVGASGGWGQLTAGRHYTVYWNTLATYALTGLIWGNASNYFRDGTVLRADNSVRYQSPSMGGVVVRGLVALGEAANGASTGTIYNGSVQYDGSSFSAGGSYLKRRTTATNTDQYAALGASYDFKVAKVSLLASQREDDLPAATSNEGLFYELSATVKVGNAGSVFLSYGAFDGTARANTDAQALSLRYDHSLSKRTRLYAGISKIKNDSGARFTINSASNAGLAVTAAGKDPQSVIVGISHTF